MEGGGALRPARPQRGAFGYDDVEIEVNQAAVVRRRPIRYAKIVSSSPSRHSVVPVASSTMFIKQPPGPRPSSQS